MEKANGGGALARQPREQWGSRLGFVLATIGSAAGIGNIWRFSYVAGESGGGAFLVVYLLAVALVGLPLIVAELSIGRAAQREAVGAFGVLAPGQRWHWIGGLGVLAAFVVLAYYAVVAGWALKYLVGSLTGSLWQAAGDGYGGFFAAFIANPLEPVLWQGLMLSATVVVVIGGVRGGIEIANKVLLPLLALLICVLAVWGMTQAGSSAGLQFLFAPDWSALLRPGVYLAAIGQAFFSLGVGMSIFITYGSYLSGQPALGRSALTIVAGVRRLRSSRASPFSPRCSRSVPIPPPDRNSRSSPCRRSFSACPAARSWVRSFLRCWWRAH